MLVISRYRVDPADTAAFLAEARTAVEVMSARPGCLSLRVGRAVDEPDLWVMQGHWESVGSYRRALGSREVKQHAVPLMYRCLDEPSAFEVRLEATAGEVAELEGALAEDG